MLVATEPARNASEPATSAQRIFIENILNVSESMWINKKILKVARHHSTVLAAQSVAVYEDA